MAQPCGKSPRCDELRGGGHVRTAESAGPLRVLQFTGRAITALNRARYSSPVSSPDRAERPPRRATALRLLQIARTQTPLLAAGLFFLVIGTAASLAYPQGVRLLI